MDYNILQLCKYVIGAFISAHWMACGWCFMIQLDEENNWAQVRRPGTAVQEVLLENVPNKEPQSPVVSVHFSSIVQYVHNSLFRCKESQKMCFQCFWLNMCKLPQEYFGESYYSAGPGCLYLGGLYWSAMTMSTIGYGDIVPANAMEMAFATFSMVCGAFAYG